MRNVLTLLLVGVSSACLYGFASTFEPSRDGSHLKWRIAYGAAVIAGIVAIGLFMRASLRADSREREGP